MNSVVHFEMPYEDKDRAAKFYNEAFGWKANIMGPEMESYIVVQTADTDDKGMIKEPGRINGGLFKKSAKNSVVSFVVAVDDIREAMQKVEAAGGKIIGGSKLGEPDEIPGVGTYIAVQDTEGNKVALLKPKPMMEVHA